MSDWSSADGRLGPAAAWYANKGWKIHPVSGVADGRCTCGTTHKESKDIGKHPASKNGQKDATTDINQINAWWQENPDYNVGLYARESGFFVIDIDPRSGGYESFEKLEELVEGALPPTVEAITGVWGEKGLRGRHLIYKCDPSEKLVGNFNKDGLKGLDIKHNGYILLAPSRHFSGVLYEWKPGHAPWEMEVAEAPEQLLNFLRIKGARKSTKSVRTGNYGESDWDEILDDLDYIQNGERVDIKAILEEGIDEGARSVTVYSLACALANKMGTDPVARNAIESMMIRFNYEKIRPPMELEGSDSLLLHTHRAIDFVRDNPKENLKWAGISDFVEESKDYLAKLRPEAPQGSGDAPDPEGDFYLDTKPGNFVGNQIEQLAKKGMSVDQAISGGNLVLPKDQDAISEEDGGTPGNRTLSDTGNGRRLVDMYQSVVRYTAGLGWFYWDGNFWRPDEESLNIQELAKRVSTAIAAEVLNYDETQQDKRQEILSWAKQAKSNARITNMIRSANSDKRVIVPVFKWDSDSHLIGVENGVVDLKKGELLQGRPEIAITKKAAVSYTPGLRNVRWEQFLDHVTRGDKELQEWLQKAVGYTLTGLNNQDVLFLVYGPPGSGKNTFVETIFNALGKTGYAWMLDTNVLVATEKKSSSDEYHMAELRGRRMVWVDELPEGDRIKENQVKKMTGSATLSARSPGEKPFTFESRAKLWITTNHRPIITDDAMWRRLRPIPLTNVPEKPDPGLKEYLSDPDGGLPAVFSWAVDGAIKYLNSSETDPLGWCSAVKEAADIYRKNEDRLGLFLGEETVEMEGASTPIKRLFNIYRFWSEDRGEKPLTQIAFQRKLSDRGVVLVGEGSRAEVMGLVTRPRSVPSGEIDYSTGILGVAQNYLN